MDRALFDRSSVHSYRNALVAEIPGFINAMRDGVLESSDAEDQLASFVAQKAPKIAVLNLEDRSGKRTKTQEMHGGRLISQEVIAVSVPVSGNIQTLDITPTSMTLGARGTFSHQSLVLTLPDDERLEKDLNSLLATIQHNLDQLKKDLSGVQEQMFDAGKQAIDRKREEIKKRRSLDSGRSFPIS